ncbi:MAG TPA: pyridoxamine 5'-phosphate oxidase family protein [Bacteroidales bacterium]|nr:pyridoxamine 5'-phosphate oxidase family protein [Bacteroidales bacterium]
MNQPDQRIIQFIKKHHVLTLATSYVNIPYCANCFYVYSEEDNMLIFTSDFETKHIRDILSQNIVAGSIVLETNVIGKIQGVQLQGKITEATGEMLKKARSKYLKRFPVAMLMKTNLWTVELTFLKFTDNRLGFGKKLIWGKEQPAKE